MAEQHEPKPTERTPKGLEVPIPKRKEFFENLKRAAEPKEPERSDEKGSSKPD
jgi:hypothetical protein